MYMYLMWCLCWVCLVIWVQACEMDEGSVEKLMQRAHLYESMEKYKLSVSDLKKVLKIEPGHRMATLTLNRLIKMLD